MKDQKQTGKSPVKDAEHQAEKVEKHDESEVVSKQEPLQVPPPAPNFILLTVPTDGSEPKQIRISDHVRNFIEMFANTEVGEDLRKRYVINNMKFYMVVEEVPQQP